MKSKELQELEQEALDQEPSLDKMVDLNDPAVLKGLGQMAADFLAEEKAAENSIKEALHELQDRSGPRPPQSPRPRMGSPYTPSDPETTRD